MAIPARFYRVPVLIFAVLAASFYVYAKSGGTLPGRQSSATSEETPAIPTFAGSKSAPVITPSAPGQVPGQGVPSANKPAAPKAVLSGSKSGSVASPQDFAPAGPAPAPAHYAGKSMTPPPAVPPTPPPPPYRPNASPKPDIVTMHGTKSAPMIGPESFAPTPQPVGNAPNPLPPNPTRPTTALRPLPPPEYVPPNAPAGAPRRDTMGGSKSKPVFGPESFAPQTANGPNRPQPAAPQTALPQQGVPQPPSPQQSLKKAVNSWINPTNQRAASR